MGATIGAFSGIAASAAARYTASRKFAPPVACAASLMLTGALHLDGFLDSCDALFASVVPERRREIMKDPRHGTYAIAGLAIIGPLWLTAASEFEPHDLPKIIAWTNTVGRIATVVAAFTFSGPASTRWRPDPMAWMILAIEATLAIGTIALLEPQVRVDERTAMSRNEGALMRLAGPSVMLCCAIAAALGIGRFAACRLRGELTGDTYGFTLVIVEVGLLFAHAREKHR